MKNETLPNILSSLLAAPQPCDDHRCENGKCVPGTYVEGYECDCYDGYKGTYCDESE